MKKISILFALLALTACADSGKAEPPKEAPPPKAELKVDNMICPQVAVLKEADEAFDYGGETPDPAQLVAKARLNKITGDCAYRTDAKKGIGADIAFKVQAVAARGARLGGNQVSFPYFIAVIDPSDAVLSRQIVTAQFKFSGAEKVVEINEPLHVFIPLSEKTLTAGPDYRVLVGFTPPSSPPKTERGKKK